MPLPLASDLRISASFALADSRPADWFAAHRPDDARPGNSSMNAIFDDGTLELGEHAEHLEQRAPSRRGCIDRLPIHVEIAAGTVQLAEEAHEILQRAAEPVYRPCRDHIDPATCGR